MGGHSNTIRKLVGSENYRTWNVQVKALLESKDLWKFIDTATPPIQRKEESEEDFAERLSIHHSKKAEAKFIIISNVSGEIVLDLECVSNATDAWTFLQ